MTRIIYKSRFNSLPNEESALILKEISGTGVSEVVIKFEGVSSGILVIGDERIAITSPTTRLNLSSLNDGLYTPVLVEGSSSFICSPFIKRQGMILRPSPDGRDISRLEILISSLTERISGLEDELRILRKEAFSQNSINL